MGLYETTSTIKAESNVSPSRVSNPERSSSTDTSDNKVEINPEISALFNGMINNSLHMPSRSYPQLFGGTFPLLNQGKNIAYFTIILGDILICFIF